MQPATMKQMDEAYQTRLNALNSRQRQAVEHIDGPLLVLAGPGTGKTELLSMRAAHILRQTDTLPSSILCLTFTESGAVAMRERLRSIIGADAYKVAIHTFHGFGTEIINQNREYFYRGAEFQPADELTQYEILREIFASLDYSNPLAGMNGDEYTHLRDTLTTISELKRSGLTSDELRAIIDANEIVLDVAERQLAEVFSSRVSKTTADKLAPLAQVVAEVDQPQLPTGITPLANTLALSIAHAVDQAVADDSTKPITAWKNTWLEKNDRGELVFRDRKRHTKLRAVAHVYFEYMRRMDEAGLYDYDDMILQVIHALETQADLRANIQEKYLYLMVDEFQDTSLAQLRLLFDIAPETDANVMAVGDDDQAIYSFQGADISNIHSFRTHFDNPAVVVLTDNYRSTASVLSQARAVITQSTDRLEQSLDGLSKQLTAHRDDEPRVELHEYSSVLAERQALAQAIKQRIDDGTAPSDIAVFARRHHELVALLPYLAEQGIAANYERRDDALSHDIIRLVEHILLIIDALHRDAHDEADALLPEILAHPAWGYDPADIYQLSLASYRNRQLWLELMQASPTFKSFADWLIIRSAAVHVDSLEQQIDEIIGSSSAGGSRSTQASEVSGLDSSLTQHAEASGDSRSAARDSAVAHDDEKGTETERQMQATEAFDFVSPLHSYFFSPSKLAAQPDRYLDALEALRTVRDRVREHAGHDQPTVQAFLEFLAMHRELGTPLTITRHRSDQNTDRINLMTVHKSKGLEFDHAYILGAVDNMWGERVRSRSRLISYPENLELSPAGDSYDERLRLFYVAMTRARRSLTMSYASESADAKPTLAASFLSGLNLEPITSDTPTSIDELTTQAELDWRGSLTTPMRDDMRALLAPVLERYKLSATHLGNFLDVTRGGPQNFLLTNLLRFPQAKSASAQFGTAIHATLQRAHDTYRATGSKRPLEDILGDYERILREQHLPEYEFDAYLSRGIDALSAYLSEKYDSFSDTQQTELGFGGQEVMLGEARLTGALDLVDIDTTAKTIRVTDYKTGKPSRDWKGKTAYEKMKLHRYRQQLMFYQLLVENSRDYSKYTFAGGVLQFVEPSSSKQLLALEESFSTEELTEFTQLIAAVWHCITTLDLPDISDYDASLKGIQQFERNLIDKYSSN